MEKVLKTPKMDLIPSLSNLDLLHFFFLSGLINQGYKSSTSLFVENALILNLLNPALRANQFRIKDSLHSFNPFFFPFASQEILSTHSYLPQISFLLYYIGSISKVIPTPLSVCLFSCLPKTVLQKMLSLCTSLLINTGFQVRVEGQIYYFARRQKVL